MKNGNNSINNNIINNSHIISNQEQKLKSEKEIMLERNRRKAKAQLLLMLDNEEKIKNDQNKFIEKENEFEEEPNLNKEVNNINLSNNIINEIEIDPLDDFMQDLEKQEGQIVKQVENFDEDLYGAFSHKKAITLQEILHQEEKENAIQEEKENPEEEEDSYHENFIEAVNNTIQPLGNNQNMLQNNQQGNQAMILYDEDYLEYKSQTLENNSTTMENYWKIMKDNIDKGKVLKEVDHSKMNYDYFQKNLYIESPEISKLSPEEVTEIRKSHGQILVKGKEIPRPILNFSQCGLSSTIIQILEQKEIKEPFPIQMQAIPAIMSGRDCMGISETGSGKTLAYVLPMIRHVLGRINTIKQNNLKNSKNNIEGPIGLVLVPTRELATQIYEEIRTFTRFIDIKTSCVYGGTALKNQINELKSGSDIVIATPARLIDILCLSNGKITNLTRTTFVVLDEADRLFDLGFEPQISKIVRNIRPQKQIVMFSATFPKQIQILAKKLLKRPIEIVIGGRGQSAKNIEQHVEIIKKKNSFIKLLEILEKHMDLSTIIFVDVQNEAIELWKQLFDKNFSVALLHGQMDQEDRLDALDAFKKGEKQILVTTSITARGIDAQKCGMVINFRCPNHKEDYIHRIGRTGRAGKKGLAYTFLDPDEEDLYAEDIIQVMEMSEQEVSEELKEIARNYRSKLLRGDAEKFRISGYLGHGYQFNKLEKEKKKIEQRLLLVAEEEGGNNNGNNNNENSQALVIRKKSLIEQHKEKMRLMRKDPKAKQMALDVGMKAAKAALVAGKTEEEIIPIVQDAISKALSSYKPNVSLIKGTENASKIIEEWEAKDNQKNHIFSCEFEINDYPQLTRQKFTKQEFLTQIGDTYDVDIIQRGTLCDFGKTLLPGHKSLHLLIKGKAQNNVHLAYIELKRNFDESALNYFTRYDAEYIGKMSKFKI